MDCILASFVESKFTWLGGGYTVLFPFKDKLQ